MAKGIQYIDDTLEEIEDVLGYNSEVNSNKTNSNMFIPTLLLLASVLGIPSYLNKSKDTELKPKTPTSTIAKEQIEYKQENLIQTRIPVISAVNVLQTMISEQKQETTFYKVITTLIPTNCPVPRNEISEISYGQLFENMLTYSATINAKIESPTPLMVSPGARKIKHYPSRLKQYGNVRAIKIYPSRINTKKRSSANKKPPLTYKKPLVYRTLIRKR